MRVMLKELDVSYALKPIPFGNFCGSSFPIELFGVRQVMSEEPVSISATVVNADGIAITAEMIRGKDGAYRCRFAASNFDHYGKVKSGVKIVAALASGTVQVLVVADLEIKAASPSAEPGNPTANYARKGDEQFVRSVVVGDIQHYKKVTISYDEDMEEWGFNLEGDYILVDGEFILAV